jgi:hypothetical protein
MIEEKCTIIFVFGLDFLPGADTRARGLTYKRAGRFQPDGGKEIALSVKYKLPPPRGLHLSAGATL